MFRGDLSSLLESPFCFGLASCIKPGRAPVLMHRLTLDADRLRHFIDRSVFSRICFFRGFPASWGIASWVGDQDVYGHRTTFLDSLLCTPFSAQKSRGNFPLLSVSCIKIQFPVLVPILPVEFQSARWHCSRCSPLASATRLPSFRPARRHQVPYRLPCGPLNRFLYPA